MVDNAQSPVLVGIAFGSVRAVRQLCKGHGREANVRLSVRGLYLFEDLPDGVTAPFSSNYDARVENQSHANAMPSEMDRRGGCAARRTAAG
jgi:hypothetical protein